MRRKAEFSDEDFANEWNAASNVDDVCTRFGISREYAHISAKRLRRRGIPIKSWKKPYELHGLEGSRIYITWCNMIQRCTNKNNTQFHDYGGRGITVCREWLESFVAFKSWAIANGYSDNLMIDRKDNDKGYCPENCRMATRTQQNRNIRKQKKGRATSKYKGVSWNRDSKKWTLSVGPKGKSKFRGYFRDEVEAAREYDRIAKEEFGDFACLNFKETEKEEVIQ